MFENVDGTRPPYAGITNFTPSIPKLYWDVDSQEQGISQLWKVVDMLCQQDNGHIEQTNANTADIAELRTLFRQFVEHGFDEHYARQIERWFDENAWRIYERSAKQVFFGLTRDGHLCAYVPDGWSEITFDTGAVYGTPEYGRLILRFDADGHPADSARGDYRMLDSTVQSAIEAAAGAGIGYSERKLSVNAGDGLSIDPATNTVNVL